MCLRYSSSVVAPMHWISPRDSAGLSTFEASIAPSAPPAPTSVCSSSMNSITSLHAAHLGHHGLDALLELAAVLRAGDHQREVEHDHALAAQDLGHLVVDDALGEALDDGGLADAGLAEQHRVVLGAAREDLHHALDLVGAADDRVELALARDSVRSRPKASSAGVLLLPPPPPPPPDLPLGPRPPPCGSPPELLLLLLLGGVGAEELEHLLAHVLELDAQVQQHLGGDALVLLDQAQEQVLGADVVVPQVRGLLHGQLEHLLRAGREGQLAHRHHRRAGLDDLLDLGADLVQVDRHVLEHVGRDAGALLDEAEQDVLGAEVLVVEPLGLLAGQVHHLLGAVCEAVEHCGSLWRSRRDRRELRRPDRGG
jgi:hypothetical protein